MKDVNNSNEFEFQERSAEFEESSGEFEYAMEGFTDKTEVLIFTDNYRIRGKIALVPGARLTDYMLDAKPFIAAIAVEVQDKGGNLILKAPFLNINRDHIEMIVPADIADTNS